MLKSLLDSLTEATDPLPRFTPPRCLLERQAIGGCDACQTACPHDAIQTGPPGRSIQVAADLCTSCGMCVQVCPSGALEFALLPALQVVRDSTGTSQDATLTCAESGAGGPNLPCLGRVTPALLSAAGAWDVPLTLIHGACATCPVGAPDVPDRLHTALADAARLREPTGRPARVTIRPAEDGDSERATRLDRRGAFTALFRAGRQHVARAIPDRPLPFVDWSVPEDRTPEEWKWRRRTLRPAPPADAAVNWPAPVVDDRCIDCPVCEVVCPTEAITRDLQPDGGVKLLLNLAACTGCQSCLKSCPPQAIHMQEAWYPAAFEVPVLLRESDRVM